MSNPAATLRADLQEDAVLDVGDAVARRGRGRVAGRRLPAGRGRRRRRVGGPGPGVRGADGPGGRSRGRRGRVRTVPHRVRGGGPVRDAVVSEAGCRPGRGAGGAAVHGGRGGRRGVRGRDAEGRDGADVRLMRPAYAGGHLGLRCPSGVDGPGRGQLMDRGLHRARATAGGFRARGHGGRTTWMWPRGGQPADPLAAAHEQDFQLSMVSQGCRCFRRSLP